MIPTAMAPETATGPLVLAGQPYRQCRLVSIVSPAHTQALNGNLKAYAAWWLWARLGGWNGESWVDFLGTWDGQGVYYRNSDYRRVGEAWPTPGHLWSPAGDLDGDGIDDLIGIWPLARWSLGEVAPTNRRLGEAVIHGGSTYRRGRHERRRPRGFPRHLGWAGCILQGLCKWSLGEDGFPGQT